MYREYMAKCMGEDEFVPATGKCERWFGIGLTILDSLDTLLLMGLTEEYEESRNWAEKNLKMKNNVEVSVFEIVIRALGGMNSAYELTGDEFWKQKSVELAELLLPGFNVTKTGCPPRDLKLADSVDREGGYNEEYDSALSNPAEVGTLQLEFRTVSRMAGNEKYAKAVDRCMESLLAAMEEEEDGLVPDLFDLDNGQFLGSALTISAGVDSFYEMLLKTWVAFGKKDEKNRVMYERAVEGIMKHLARKQKDYMIVGRMERGHEKTFSWRMDHLECFFPGNLAYAALHGLGGGVNSTGEESYMTHARALTRGCVEMTKAAYHGLPAESTSFRNGDVKAARGADKHYLRPEIVEALYYMDQIDSDGNDKYKEWGKELWMSIRKFCQVKGKKYGILSTTENLLSSKGKLEHSGKLESFAIAETFKYFFLLFSGKEGRISLDEWVFNTEAHPVRSVRGL